MVQCLSLDAFLVIFIVSFLHCKKKTDVKNISFIFMRIHIESVTDSMVNASYKELEARMKRVEDLERVHAEMTLKKELQVLIKLLENDRHYRFHTVS